MAPLTTVSILLTANTPQPFADREVALVGLPLAGLGHGSRVWAMVLTMRLARQRKRLIAGFVLLRLSTVTGAGWHERAAGRRALIGATNAA